MSLRGKIIVAIIIVMLLVGCLLTINVWLDAVRRSKLESERTAELVARFVQDWVMIVGLEKKLGEPPQSPEADRLRGTLEMSSLVRKWAIVDEARKPLLSSTGYTPSQESLRADACLDRAFSERKAAVMGNVAAAPLVLDNERLGAIRMELEFLPHYQRATPEAMFMTILWIMFLGTALLSLNIYILLRRLVLRPLELLIEASQRVSMGDYTRPIPETRRFDEMEGLIKSFNSMMREVHGYQMDMEKRISDARNEIEKTQRGLIIAQRLSAMGKLVSGIAHEINNPLGGMINAIRSLQRMISDQGTTLTTRANDPRYPDATQATPSDATGAEPTTEKIAEYLGLIREGLERIEITVKKVLQFSPRRLQPQPINLHQAVSRAIALVEHALKQKGIALEIDLGSPPPTIFGDAADIQQVFLNLLLNSIDAVARGTGRISVTSRSHPDRERKGEVAIEVTDNGCGIDEHEIDHVFDLFYTTKEVGEGSGLGLSIVHNIIENHGGRIELESKKGEATTVRITLPALKPEP